MRSSRQRAASYKSTVRASCAHPACVQHSLSPPVAANLRTFTMTLAWDSATVAVAVTLVGRQVLAAMQLPAAAWPPPDHQSTLWQSQLQASLILTLLALGNCIGDYSWSALSTAALWVRLLARACGGFLREKKSVTAPLTPPSHSLTPGCLCAPLNRRTGCIHSCRIYPWYPGRRDRPRPCPLTASSPLSPPGTAPPTVVHPSPRVGADGGQSPLGHDSGW